MPGTAATSWRWYTAILTVSPVSAVRIVPSRYKAGWTGGWSVITGYINSAAPHLTGRQFEHGVTDCYTLFRDAYHLAGIDMPDFDREDDWWSQGKSLYLDHLEAAGFYRVNPEDAQPGDVLICCFGSPTPNHAAIYCGNGELLHHIPEQLSKREGYNDKWQRRTHSIWRHRQWCESAFTGIYNDLESASASA